jgi:hypothetical protein
MLGAAASAIVSPAFALPTPSPEEPSAAELAAQRRYDELRKRGNAAAKENRNAEAIEAFLEAYAIRPSHVLACAIGRIEMLGRADAVAGAQWLTRCMNMAPIPERGQKDAGKELAAQQEEVTLRDLARARVGALRVVTDEGATVKVDGKAMGTAPLTDEVFLKPGSYRLEVSLGGRTRSLAVKLAPGESRTVDLSLPLAMPPPAPPPRPPRVDSPREESNKGLLYTGIGVGTVGLGVALGFGAAAIKAQGEEEAAGASVKDNTGHLACTTPSTAGCAEFYEAYRRTDAFTAVSVVGLSAAVVGGVMITYAFVRPPTNSGSAALRAAFVGAPGGGAMILRVRF